MIFIPSYNRADEVLALTIRFWPKTLPVTIVVRPQQRAMYSEFANKCGLREFSILEIGKDGFTATRNAILEYCMRHEIRKMVTIDDDLRFYIRNREDSPLYLNYMTDEEMEAMVSDIYSDLEKYAHVGVSAREGNNRVPEEFVENTRMMRIQGHSVDVLKRENLKFDGLIRQDIDMTVSLLRLGYKNKVYFKYAQGQKSSEMRGGIADTGIRTPELLEKNAKWLGDKHPGIVKPTVKFTKGAWGGGRRWDVTCLWKKAYKEGLEKYGVRSVC